MKREAVLKSAFSKELKCQVPEAVVLFHSTAGAPDRAITFGGATTYLECKHGTPSFDSPGIQELCCMRLEVAGHRCRYLVWQETAYEQKTLIVRPRMIAARKKWILEADEIFLGFDHPSTVTWLRRFHGV